MATTFNDRAFVELQNAVSQITTLAASAPQLLGALDTARSIMGAVRTAEETRDKIIAETDVAKAELAQVRRDRDAIQAEVAALAAKRQAALKKAMDAFAELT